MKVTDTVTGSESPEGKPLEAGSSSLNTEVKEESAEMPVEQTEMEPKGDQAEEKTEVEPSDSQVDEKTTSTNQIEVNKVDQEEDKVMRNFSIMMYDCLSGWFKY